jgi:acetylornithine deacetylase/succinyl-diaminopimelate desuccinylase family protein
MVSRSERQSILTATSELKAETIEFLQEMVRTPSVNPPGDYEDIRTVLTSQYSTYGWDVDTIWAPEDLLKELELSHPRPNILARVAKGDGPTIVLNAHIDTVPVQAEEEWNHNPFGAEIEDGYLYGRGATDCKGRIAAYTLALRALEETGMLPDDATLVLALTPDEETSSEGGAKYLTRTGRLRPDYAIVEGDFTRIWHAASGTLKFQIAITGQSSHAGLAPEKGANAIMGANRLLTAIEKYRSDLAERESTVQNVGSPTCNPTTIEGGVKNNVIPSSCSISVDARVPPDHDMTEAEHEIRELIEATTPLEGTSVDIDRFGKTGSHYFAPDEPYIQVMKQNADAILKTDVPVTGVRAGTDATYFADSGAKCVNFGPGDNASNKHGSDENVSLDQVYKAGAIVAASIADITAL